MAAALTLARRGLGRSAPNPAVGCVLVKDGRVIGRGWTQPGGRPHAETEALRRAGAAARGATAYVTLEPCAHHGKTPACAEALIAAGIMRVVVALEDPDPRVDGEGLAILRAAGVAVDLGLDWPAAAELNAGFLLRVREGRPLVTLKLASSLDGRIASHSGESRWITGEAARARAHLLRAEHDAVMIGSETAVRDDPELTCRLPGMMAFSPKRVVVDGRLRLPLTHALVSGARQHSTLLLTLEGGDHARLAAYRDLGVEVIPVPADHDGRPDPQEIVRELAARGLNRVLIEGGSTLAASFLRVQLVDRIAWFRAPNLIGGDGVSAIAALGVQQLSEAPRFARRSLETVGLDLLETLEFIS